MSVGFRVNGMDFYNIRNADIMLKAICASFTEPLPDVCKES